MSNNPNINNNNSSVEARQRSVRVPTMPLEESRLRFSTVLHDSSDSLTNTNRQSTFTEQHHHERDINIKFGDSIFFYQEEANLVLTGDGFQNRLIGSQKKVEQDFLPAIFRIEPRLDYKAHHTYLKVKKEVEEWEKQVKESAAQSRRGSIPTQPHNALDQDELSQALKQAKPRVTFSDPNEEKREELKKKLFEAEQKYKIEKQNNHTEEKSSLGKTLLYGQIIQLVHVQTGRFLSGSATERAELDPSSLSLSLVTGGHKSTYFKVTPRYKVRLEGDKVKSGDQVVLFHLKSEQLVAVGPTYEATRDREINLSSEHTGFYVISYASYNAEGDKYVKGGDIVRVFHQDREAHIRSQRTPLVDAKKEVHYVYAEILNPTAHKFRKPFSSNELFQIELRQHTIGGTITWSEQIRLKYLPTGQYLAGDVRSDSLHLENEAGTNTIFVLIPVDKGTTEVKYGANFRLKHFESNKWLSVPEAIQVESSDKIGESFSYDRFLRATLSSKFRYQDVINFRRAPDGQVKDLTFLITQINVITSLLNLLKTPEYQKGEIDLKEEEYEYVTIALQKLCYFVNESKDPNYFEMKGIPLKKHQKMCIEQELNDILCEILQRLFGLTPEKWMNPNTQQEAQKYFEDHILVNMTKNPAHNLAKHIFTFIKLVALKNPVVALSFKKYISVFQQQMGTQIRVRAALISLFDNNYKLLQEISEDHLERFVMLLGRAKKDQSSSSELLDLISQVCATEQYPVLDNQEKLLERILEQKEQLLIPIKFEKKAFYVLLPHPEAVEPQWIAFNDFIKLAKVPKKSGNLKKSEKRDLQQRVDLAKRYESYLKYLVSQLNFFYQVAVGNDHTTEIVKEQFVSCKNAFMIMKDPNINSFEVRNGFCRLLTLWVKPMLPVFFETGIKTIWSWTELSIENSQLPGDDVPELPEKTWLSRHLTDLKETIMQLLQTFGAKRSHGKFMIYGDKSFQFFHSLLLLLESLVRYNLFHRLEERQKVFTELLDFLDPTNDEYGDELERFRRTETSVLPIECKVVIIRILSEFSDLNIRKAVGSELSRFRQQLESEEQMRSQEAQAQTLRGKKGKKNQIELQPLANRDVGRRSTMVTDDVFTNIHQDHFINVLLNTTLFQDRGLANSAFRLLFRTLRPVGDVIHTLERVELLTDQSLVDTYFSIGQGISTIKRLIQDGDISEEDGETLREILTSFINLCTIEGNLELPNIRHQNLFRNLEAHKVIFQILELPYIDGPLYHTIFKMCYLFLRQFVKHNRPNQAHVFPHLEFMLRQMGKKLNIADTLADLLYDNHKLASEIKKPIIAHIVQLIVKQGYKIKYMALLGSVVFGEGQVIRENQNLVMDLLLKNRGAVLLLRNDIKKFQTLRWERERSQTNTTVRRHNLNRKKSGANIVTMETLKENEIHRERNPDEDRLQYHMMCVSVLSRCCIQNTVAQSSAQLLLSLTDVMAVLLTEEDPSVKAIYAEFVTNGWILTERSPITDSPEFWKYLKQVADEIETLGEAYAQGSLREFENDYVTKGILPMLAALFDPVAQKVNWTHEKVGKTCTALFRALAGSLTKFSRSKGKTSQLLQVLHNMRRFRKHNQANIPDFDIEDEKFAQEINKAREEGAEDEKNPSEDSILEEKLKALRLRKYARDMRKKKGNAKSFFEFGLVFDNKRNNNVRLVEAEAHKVAELFEKQLKSSKGINLTGEDLSLHAVQDSSKVSEGLIAIGAAYVQRLIFAAISTENKDVHLKEQCFEVLLKLLDIDGDPGDNDAKDEDNYEKRNQNKLVYEKQLRERQRQLAGFGALTGAIKEISAHHSGVTVAAVRFLTQMLEGGNSAQQQELLDFFLSTPDPEFFSTIKAIFTRHGPELKSLVKDSGPSLNDVGSGSMREEDVEELLRARSEQVGSNKMPLLLLKLMQNMCEGHFVQMKLYLHEQLDNTLSHDLVKEVVFFGLYLERALPAAYSPKASPLFKLAIQFWRSLTEFCSGCSQNVDSLLSAKVTQQVNKTLNKTLRYLVELEGQEQKSSSDVSQLFSEGGRLFGLQTSKYEKQRKKLLRLVLAIFETLLSMIEGQYPTLKIVSATPKRLIQTLDWITIENMAKLMVQILDRADDEEEMLADTVMSTMLIFITHISEFEDPRHSTFNIRGRIFGIEEVFEYKKEHLCAVEIVNENNQLEKLYFRRPEICHLLQEESKLDLLQHVNRENQSEKLIDFSLRVEQLTKEIYHTAEIQHSHARFLVNYEKYFLHFNQVLVVIINALMIAFYRLDPDRNGEVSIRSEVDIILYILGALLSISSICWTIGLAWKRAELIIYNGRKKKAIKIKQKNQVRKKLGLKLKSAPDKKQLTDPTPLLDLLFLLRNEKFIYPFIYTILTLAATIGPKPLFAFHILDLALQNNTTRNVLRAVTTNWKNLLLAGLLILIIIYEYAMIGFFFFPQDFDENEGLNCETLFLCVLVTINQGVRNGGGIGDALDTTADPFVSAGEFAGRWFYDLTFFILVIIILLNVVFGIILDSFGELRDQRKAIEEDITGRCFICGLPAETFNRKGLGFHHHIKSDHNMFYYLYLYVHLKEKPFEEYTAAEQYVNEQFLEGSIAFFPVNRAMILGDTEGGGEDDSE